MKFSATLLPTDFLKLVKEILGERKHVQELITYYQSHPEKVILWLQELDQAILLFNNQTQFSKIYINAIYLKKVFINSLPFVNQVIDQADFFKPTLEAMKAFEFFDKEWQIKPLAAACIVAFYRTFMLVNRPILKEKKVQVASAIEEMLAMIALNGEKTELFQSIKIWLLDWQTEGFSQELAERIKEL